MKTGSKVGRLRRSSITPLGLRDLDLTTAAIKAAIVLVPSYLAAWLTDKMVYVVPTLAAASFFAAEGDAASSLGLGRGAPVTIVEGG